MNLNEIELPEKEQTYLIAVGKKKREIIDLPTFGSCTLTLKNGIIELVRMESTEKKKIE